MSARVCRACGQMYRGLVCHECHPRKAKAAVETRTVDTGFDALEWPGMAHGAGTVETEGHQRLNVRVEPLTGKIKGSLAYGDHVVVWSALPNGWYLVQADSSGLTGYVLGECIRLDAELVRGRSD